MLKLILEEFYVKHQNRNWKSILNVEQLTFFGGYIPKVFNIVNKNTNTQDLPLTGRACGKFLLLFKYKKYKTDIVTDKTNEKSLLYFFINTAKTPPFDNKPRGFLMSYAGIRLSLSAAGSSESVVLGSSLLPKP